MKIEVGGKTYDCCVMARTVIRYWQQWRESFQDAWIKCGSREEREKMLTQLAYTASGAEIPYSDFKKAAESEPSFKDSAAILRLIIFECRIEPTGVKNPDYGIPNDEITLLAQMSIAGMPGEWLDEFKYYELVQIIGRVAMLNNMDTSVEIMDEEDVDAFHGITDKQKKQVSEYLKRQEESGG